MPLRSGADSWQAPTTATTRRSRAARRRRARQLARRRAVALVCLIGALVALAAGVNLLITPARSLLREATSRDPSVAVARQSPKVTYARPARLIIPKIDVDAAIDYVGLTTQGAMASPSDSDTVGWYESGPRPGNKGSAVMDGHSGYADGPAVFDMLPELGEGDKILVEDERGRWASFVVRTTRLYAPDAEATEVFAPTTDRRLNLITCTGSWDAAAGTHSQRLVVFADFEAPTGSSHQQ